MEVICFICQRTDIFTRLAFKNLKQLEENWKQWGHQRLFSRRRQTQTHTGTAKKASTQSKHTQAV